MGLFDKNFKQSIAQYAKQNKWVLAELDDTRAVMEFAAAGGPLTLFITKYPETVEFLVPSAVGTQRHEVLADDLAFFLLRRNSELQQGFWGLKEIQSYNLCAAMHNEPLAELDGEKFSQIASILITEVETFEKAAVEITGQPVKRFEYAGPVTRSQRSLVRT
jgi:hypothetical protein